MVFKIFTSHQHLINLILILLLAGDKQLRLQSLTKAKKMPSFNTPQAENRDKENSLPLEKWLRKQKLRKLLLEAFCARHKDTYNYSLGEIAENLHANFDPLEGWSKSFIVQKEFRVINCNIPKVASTSIKIMMANISGTVPSSIKHMDTHYHQWKNLRKGGLADLGSFSVKDATNMLLNFTSFMFVRDPVERLISAFLDKIVNIVDGRRPELFMLSNSIQKFHNRTTVNYSSVTFDEFVRWLVVTHNNNEHFRSYHDTCFPCAINYTYIGHTETMKEDMYFIHKLIYENQSKSLKLSHKNTNKMQKQNDKSIYLEKLSSQELSTLISYVQDDALAFGYKNITFYNLL